MKKGNPYYFFSCAAIFIGACAFGLICWYVGWNLLVSYLVSVNVAACTLAVFDKGIAGKGATRVPEAVLWGVALIGGSAGLILAMHFFRHKIRKAKFMLALIAILALQVAIFDRFFRR